MDGPSGEVQQVSRLHEDKGQAVSGSVSPWSSVEAVSFRSAFQKPLSGEQAVVCMLGSVGSTGQALLCL